MTALDSDTTTDAFLVEEDDTYVQTQMLLLAAAQHNIEDLKTLLKGTSANVQDPETGMTPLHAAIASCTPEEPSVPHSTPEPVDQEELAAAKKTVQLLLENGAIWNDLDFNDETPGCVALRLGLSELYDMVVEAGVRAELLLGRLDGYFLLGEGTDEDEEQEEGEEMEEVIGGNGDANGDKEAVDGEDMDTEGQQPDNLERDTEGIAGEDTAGLTNPGVESKEYLASDLKFEDGKLLDADTNGVMMSWETDIMRLTATALCSRPGLQILNIGHGMGIIDSLLQTHAPSIHHIIEAHPTVIKKLEDESWHTKEGVQVFPGKWQDVLPKLRQDGNEYDAIFYDTFAESYIDLKRDFFREAANLLAQGGRFSFFCGQGADRQVCYDVYQRVLEVDIAEAGFEVTWKEVEVPDLEKGGQWDGVRRKYWSCKTYRLPLCWREGEGKMEVGVVQVEPGIEPPPPSESNPSDVAKEI